MILTGLVGLYEICFEQSWKMIREVLSAHGYEERTTGSPKMILKTAYKAGMIKAEARKLEEKMLVNFNDMKEITASEMNNGTGTVSAKMYLDEQGKIIPCSIHPKSSIGPHKHKTSDDINYVLSGTGKAVCDGKEELLHAGTCHICKKGSTHSIINTGDDDLVLLTIVTER